MLRQKNELLLYHIVFFILVTISVHGWALSSSDKIFIEKHTAPNNICNILTNHTDFLLKVNKCAEDYDIETCKQKYGPPVWKIDELPGYFIKRGVGRIRGREKIWHCIQKNNLTRLAVPKKYLYHIPGKDYELTDENYLVIAQEQKYSKLIIDLEGATQICELIRKVGFLDCSRGNIKLRTSDNKLVFIDTEERFFLEKEEVDFSNNQLYQGFEIMLSQDGGFKLARHFTKNGLKKIFSELKKHVPEEQSLYQNCYQNILSSLKLNFKNKNSWNFVSYFKKIFPQS